MAKGFDAVTLADVAAQVGLARTAIYNYFPDREALLFAWTDREVRKTIESLESELAKAETFADKLEVFIRSQLVEFGRRHLPPGKEVVQFMSPETYGRFMDHIEPLEKVLEGVISEGVDAKEFTQVDPANAVPMVMACIGSERVPLATGAVDVEEATSRVAEFVLRAMGAGRTS